MGRKRAFEPSQALQKAMMVFWEKGYGVTSIDDLEAATGVGRKSLYRTFTDKHALFLQSLEIYRRHMVETNLRPLTEPDAGLTEIRGLLEKLVALAGTPVGSMGCLICNTAMELARDDPEAAGQVEAYFAQITRAVTNALTGAVARGDLDLDPPAIQQEANFLLGVIQSLCVLGRAGAAPEVVSDVAAGALRRLA